MNGTGRIGPDHHIARYCSPITCQGGEISHKAFRLDDNGVSVNWLEHFQGPREIQIDRIRNDVSKQLDIKENGRFAVLKIRVVESVYKPMFVQHEPSESNPSHAEIRGWPNQKAHSTMIATRLAARISNEDIFPGKLVEKR